MKQENKAETLQLLCATINSTREGGTENFENSITMSLEQNEDVVKIFRGYRLLETVNVACDSPMAMCRDILKARCFQ